MFPVVVSSGQKPGLVGAAAPVTSYANAGGTGDRTAIITVTSNSCMNAGTDSNLVDGAFGTNSTDSRDFHSGVTGGFIEQDFGAGNEKVIDEWKWYQDNTSTHSTWVVEAGNDGLHWVELKASFTLGGTAGAQVISWTNSLAFRRYRLRQTHDNSGASSSPWDEEIENKLVGATVTTPVTNVQSYGSRGGAGNRTSIITITTTATMGGGSTIDKLINGTAFRAGTDNATDSCFWSGGQSGVEVKLDFGASYSPIITEMTWFQDGVGSHGDWKMAVSADDMSYTDIGSSFTLGGAARQTYTSMSGNVLARRYMKLIQLTGTTSSGPWLREMWLKLAA